MFRSSSNLDFPRKVVVYYLLFCLMAVTWLTIGILYASHTIVDSRATSTCLARLGKQAAALELEYLRSGTENLQETLLASPWMSEIYKSYIVSLEGTILAHVNTLLIGQPAPEHKGSALRWGNVSGIQYQDEQGHTLSEYRVPLVAGDNHFGSLRIEVQQPTFWDTLAQTARLAPAVVLLPLVLIAAGGFVLARLTGPLARVEGQLRDVSQQRPTVAVQIRTIPTKDAISMGWNRLVALLENSGTSNAGQDIKNRLAEVLAARQETGLQEVLDNLVDGIAVTDLEGRITFANRAVAALLNTDTSLEELKGIELAGQLLKSADDPTAVKLFAEGSMLRPVVAEIQPHGDAQQHTLRVARLPLEGESLRGHVWSVRDVTQQKLTEKSRDQFIDAATHELRTPLSNIKAYAETLVSSQSIDVEQQKEFCNIINSEVTRLARFVDDLLSISSMEAGSIVIDRQRTISARLFEEVLAKVQPLMKQENLEFDVKLPEKMADLQLDKDKIVTVLVNLLGNAAKYTPAGGRVSLRVKLDEAELQFAIQDTGVGIAADEIPKVFDKFFRSADPRVQEEVGTGLGLSLAREVIRMHGGEITVESQLNQGTTFMVTVPI